MKIKLSKKDKVTRNFSNAEKKIKDLIGRKKKRLREKYLYDLKGLDLEEKFYIEQLNDETEIHNIIKDSRKEIRKNNMKNNKIYRNYYLRKKRKN